MLLAVPPTSLARDGDSDVFISVERRAWCASASSEGTPPHAIRRETVVLRRLP